MSPRPVRGGRNRGRPRKTWGDNVTEWTGLSFAEATRATENREHWRGLVIEAASLSPQQRKSLLREQ